MQQAQRLSLNSQRARDVMAAYATSKALDPQPVYPAPSTAPLVNATLADAVGIVVARGPSIVSRAGLAYEGTVNDAAKINAKSPTAQRMLKFSFNLIDDGLVGQQVFAGEATRLAYMTDEAVEGRDAFLEKRDPDWSEFPWYY